MFATPTVLTHYFLPGATPFRSLSPLPDAEAMAIMRALYADTPFAARFQDPLDYLTRRRRTEQWVRAGFIAKGGRPRSAYPVYMVLGRSPWIERNIGDLEQCCVRIPLAAFGEGDVSFTYPDSMISLWFATDQPPAYYRPDLHGHIFTRGEILALVREHGMPEAGWQPALPPDLAPYIEAQVWNFAPLAEYAGSHTAGVQ